MSYKLINTETLDQDILEAGHYDLEYLEGREVAKMLVENMKVQLETNGAAAILRAAGRDIDAIVRDLANNAIQALL